MNLREWYLAREPNERYALLALGTVIGLLLLYTLVWEPVRDLFHQQHLKVSEQRQLVDWMRKTGAEIRQLQPQAQAGGQRLQGPLLSVVDQTIRSAQLNLYMKRLEPQGTDKVQIWFEQAPFDTLIRWMGELQGRHGIAIQSLNIERNTQIGQVNARIELQGGGA